MSGKEWRSVIGYEGIYEVSNYGEVRTVIRKGRKKVFVLKPAINGGGYENVGLWKNRKCKRFTIHRLVAIAFCEGKTKERYCVNHKDGNKLNNRCENLEWCTFSENSYHAYKIGLKEARKGEEHPKNKLSKDTVTSIRKRAYTDEDFTIRGEARKQGVTKTTIRNILRRKIWEHTDKGIPAKLKKEKQPCLLCGHGTTSKYQLCRKHYKLQWQKEKRARPNAPLST